MTTLVGLAVAIGGFFHVQLRAPPRLVAKTEEEVCPGPVLLRRLEKQAESGIVILLYAVTGPVQYAQIALTRCVTQPGSLLVKLYCFGGVLFHAAAGFIA